VSISDTRYPAHNTHIPHNGGSDLQGGYHTLPHHSNESPLLITLYKRTFPVDGAPEAFSLLPFSVGQKCTFAVGDVVYEAGYSEVPVDIPDEAKVDQMQNRLAWGEGKGRVKSTAKEVFDLAAEGKSGFSLVK